MNSINDTLKIIGSILIVVLLWQGYMIYELKNTIDGSSHSKSSVAVELLQSPGIVRLDPFREFQTMQQEFDRAFGRFNSFFANDNSFKLAFENFSYKPLLDMFSSGEEYVIKTDIPGVKKSNIDIKVENNLLTIKAEVSESKDSNSTSFISKERYVKKFARTISLADDADVSKMKSDYIDGVLTVTIPKK
ncbi:Hsp20/alpha crystallin family protein [Candidatus Sulfurimonas marisnigri]|uniref:Hsp20/alpha crystallin family protein n=1 Tax=Candidatus Sulfurimonas marisnigri TaxID=2740405 RepID=A0A7S7M098_9BACT|nr:Hsp20/alpha crystallin family protein [Candidatus Sulfurimonas marisnigri]QOY54737.1 Hsp20/alpha crystallin family protein [Candidatus Sulfurimonas marisnigri]